MSTLDRYLEEREEQSAREERELQLEESPAIQELFKAYETWLDTTSRSIFFDVVYYDAAKLVSDMQYTASDVQTFSALLEVDYHASGPREGSWALFLTALMNKGNDDTYVIHTGHVDPAPTNLGFENCKNVTVVGDVGKFAGRDMSGGTLTILGNAGPGTGKGMSGGVLRVEGDIESIGGWRKGGEIYESGKKIWPEEEDES